MNRRLLTGVVAIACAAILAPAAFAHGSGLNATGLTCNTAAGNWEFSWSVGPTDYLHLKPVIKASDRTPAWPGAKAIPVGTSLGTGLITDPATTKLFPDSVPGTTTSVTATVSVLWTGDNFTAGPYSKTITFGGTCKQNGTIQLKKVFINGPSSQRANLFVKQGSTVVTSAANVGPAGGQTPVVPVQPGPYDISETAGSNTDLAGYSKTWACVQDGITVVSGLGTGPSSVTVAAGKDLVCTITNTFNKLGSSTVTAVHAGAGASDLVGAAAITSAAIGSTVHDKATVSGTVAGGTPTGTVDFLVYRGSIDCTGASQAAGTVTLDANGVAHPSADQVVGASGLSFKAHYNGSAVYSPSDGVCEPLTAAKLVATVATKIHNASHAEVTSVVVGNAVHDSATVSGTEAGGTPGGSVTFQWFTNNTCSGQPAATSSPFALSGGSADATTFAQAPGAAGGFAFRAVYAGSDTYGGATGECEPLTVTSSSTPSPPSTPTPRADITVAKSATPAVRLPLGGGTVPITYTIVVSNNGPDAAVNVKVADAAPVDVKFVSAATAAGSCRTTELALDCTISSLASGASVTITVSATVNATGTKVNTVKVTTDTPETNGNNNTATAQTVVTAPVTPPTVKPTPKPLPEICNTVVVTPKMLRGNGKTQKITVKVTKGKKGVAGARVKITGPGISKTVRSGGNGMISVAFTPGKPGIVRVAILGSKACNTQRIGVVGTFEPPVTG